MPADSLLERRYRVLGRNSPLFYDKPLHLVRGEGVWLYDADGKRYLDAYNNVPHVGHCHPRVVAALSRQAATLNTHTRYLDENVVAYAERLTALFDPHALHGDVLLHRQRSERAGAAHRARLQRRHGNHRHGLGVSRQYRCRDAGELAVHTAGQARPVRAHGPRHGPLSGSRRTQRRAARDRLCETRSSARSMHLPQTGYASRGFCSAPRSRARDCPRCRQASWRRRSPTFTPPAASSSPTKCRRASAASAATCGGIRRLGVIPDIVTLGKPMGNGHPLAGVIARAGARQRVRGAEHVLQHLRRQSGFGRRRHGGPRCARRTSVCCRMQSPWAATRCSGCRQLADRHALIGDVRGSGLFFAVELVSDRQRQDAGDGARPSGSSITCASAAC